MSVEPLEKELYVGKPAREMREIILEQLNLLSGKNIKNLDHQIICNFGSQPVLSILGSFFGSLPGELIGSALTDKEDLPVKAVFTFQQININVTKIIIEVSEDLADDILFLQGKYPEVLTDTMKQLYRSISSYEVPTPPRVVVKSAVTDFTNLPDDIKRRLEKLTRLHDRGSFTDEEFEEQKYKLLGM